MGIHIGELFLIIQFIPDLSLNSALYLDFMVFSIYIDLQLNFVCTVASHIFWLDKDIISSEEKYP